MQASDGELYLMFFVGIFFGALLVYTSSYFVCF